MNSACRFLAGFFSALSLLGASSLMAGGGQNSTQPALASVQLASILCHIGAGADPQGDVRNTRLKGEVAPTGGPGFRLCRSKGSQPGGYRRTHQAIARAQTREISRTPGQSARARVDATATARSPQQAAGSRDSFKQETWFVAEGAKSRRVTKHLARKQGWAGPQAMQAVRKPRLAATRPAPTDAAVMAQLPVHGATEHSGGVMTLVRPESTRLKTSRPTEGPVCDSVATGLCERQGLPPVSFQMMHPQAVVALPQFEPGNGSATAAKVQPWVLVKKFRPVAGVMKPDPTFSDDGLAAVPIPLPPGEEIRAFTLAPDKLIVLSAPGTDPVLSRVTLVDLDEAGSPADVDGGTAPGLWVKGELLRYHDNSLYTLSPQEHKIFIYPDLASDSTRSRSAVRVVDLSAVDLAGGQLVSVLADSVSCHLAVRRQDPGSDVSRFHLWRIDDAGTVSAEGVIRDLGNQDDAWQLCLDDGERVLSKIITQDPELAQLACQDPVRLPWVHKASVTRKQDCPSPALWYRFGCRKREIPEGKSIIYDPAGCTLASAGSCQHPTSGEDCQFSSERIWNTEDGEAPCRYSETIRCPSCTARVVYTAGAPSPDCMHNGSFSSGQICDPEGCFPGCGLTQQAANPADSSGTDARWAGAAAIGVGVAGAWLIAAGCGCQCKKCPTSAAAKPDHD